MTLALDGLVRPMGKLARAESADRTDLPASTFDFVLSRDSPDESQTSINVRVFPTLLQDRREVLTATSTSGKPRSPALPCRRQPSASRTPPYSKAWAWMA